MLNSFVDYTDYLMLFFLIRLFFVLRIYQKAAKINGGESLQHYYGIFLSVFRVWVWFDKVGLQKPSFKTYIIKEL